MLTLLVPASTPTGVDVYADSETGALVEQPAGSPPPVDPAAAIAPAPAAPQPTMSAMDAEAYGMGAKPGDPMPVSKKPAAAFPRRARHYDAESPEAQAIGATAATNAAKKVTPGYRTIIDLESSAGENVGHEEISTPTYRGMTAAGESGLVPPNVYMLVRDEPDLRKKYYDSVTKLLGGKEYSKGTERQMSIAEANKITAVVNGSPAFDKELAERFWQNELEATAKRGADGKKTYDEDRARMYHFAGGKGTAYYDAVQAGKDNFSFKVKGQVYSQAVADADDLEEELSKWRSRRAQYQDSEYDHPLLAATAPATGVPAGMASDASVGASAPPAGAQPLPFDDFEPVPGEVPSVDVPMAPTEDPSAPIPGYAPPPAPSGPPAPPAPGTPGAGVGAVSTIQMPGGRDVQVTAPSSPQSRIAPMFGKASTEPVVGGLPVAERIVPGPFEKIDAAKTEGAAPPPTSTAIASSKVGMAGAGASTAPNAGAAPAAAPAESEVDKLRREIRQARDAYAKGPNIPAIDPERLWKSKSTGGKVMSAIALALGTFGSGMTGGPNAALQLIQQAIADDIESQKLTAAQQQAAWAASYNVIDSMIDELAVISKDTGAAKAPQFAAMNKLMGAREAIKQFSALRTEYAALPWHSAISGRIWPGATKASKYEADMGPALAQIIFELSGKQSNEREAARLTAMLPSSKAIYETKGAGFQKFDAIQKWVQSKYDAIHDAAAQAYPGRDFDSLSLEERRALTGESENREDDTLMLQDMFADFEGVE